MSRWWLQPVIGALVAFFFYLPFFYLKYFDIESILYLSGILILTVAIGIGIVARRMIFKHWVSWRFLRAIAVFWAVTIPMFLWTEDMRPWARWLVASHRYEAEVMQQIPGSRTGLRHIEWDGWGWAGMDTSVELVYDPTDSLAHQLRQDPKGRYADLANITAKIQRLGRGWYSVTLFTSEVWDDSDD